MRKQTNLAEVKLTALALLSTEINETPCSPMIVKHPFTDTGVSAIPDGKGGVEMIDLTEDDAQLRWRQSMARQIDNLNKYCLIQNIGNMGKIGQEYLLNRDGSIPANDDANPKYAEIGRRLMQSGTGIVTEHGILFIDEDVQFQELYHGQVFPPYLYDASILCTAKAEYHGKVEYLYLPCERAAIDKSIGRLGAPDAESVSIIFDDSMLDNREWMRRLREMTSSESIYDINGLVGAISNADMQLDKLTAVAEYAGVEDAKSITALANSLGLFTLIDGAEDNEDVGKHFVEHDPDYGVPETVVDFIDYDMLGEHIADELNGLFVSSGFVCMESGYSISDVLDNEQGNHSILISSHIVSDLEKLCDYVAFLHKGKLLLCEEKDQLLAEYGLIHCTAEELQNFPAEAIKHKRENPYGVNAMVLRSAMPAGVNVSPISIEELFVFMVKEAK